MDDFLEISDVKDGEDKADVTVVAVTVLKRFDTCLADVQLRRHAHASIKRPIFGNGTSASGMGLVEIEEAAVNKFNSGLVDDVLI